MDQNNKSYAWPSVCEVFPLLYISAAVVCVEIQFYYITSCGPYEKLCRGVKFGQASGKIRNDKKSKEGVIYRCPLAGRSALVMQIASAEPFLLAWSIII